MVLQWKSFCFPGAIQFHINAFEHRIQVTGNIRIPEADHPVSLLLQPHLPFAIALGDRIVVVMTAIELNDQTFCWAEEVHNIGTDRRLTPEMCTFDR